MNKLFENWRKYMDEAWAVKSSKKEKGQSAGFRSLSKPVYFIAGREGEAHKAVQAGEELHGWDKYGQLVAEAYADAPMETPDAKEAFLRLGHHVIKAFPKVTSAYKVEFVKGQPYQSAEEMAAKVKESGILQISSDFNQSDIFGPVENLMFRAVHDYYGHFKAGGHEADPSKLASFDFEGELRAFNNHLKGLPKSEMAKAMFTEVIGQASYFLYYGAFPDQKMVFLDDFDHVNLGAAKGYSIKNGDLSK